MKKLFILIEVLFILLTSQCVLAVTPKDVLSSVDIEVSAEVLAPCTFTLGSNSLLFNLKAKDDDSLLENKALPVKFRVSCPYANQYHYGFETSEVEKSGSKTCAKGKATEGKEYILFCLKHSGGNKYNIVKSVNSDVEKSYFTGIIPPGRTEQDFIEDEFLFYAQKAPAGSGEYKGTLTVVFFVD